MGNAARLAEIQHHVRGLAVRSVVGERIEGRKDSALLFIRGTEYAQSRRKKGWFYA